MAEQRAYGRKLSEYISFAKIVKNYGMARLTAESRIRKAGLEVYKIPNPANRGKRCNSILVSDIQKIIVEKSVIKNTAAKGESQRSDAIAGDIAENRKASFYMTIQPIWQLNTFQGA